MIYLTIICGFQLLLLLGAGIALLLERKATGELLAHFETMHQQERARFLGAVQRPELVQPAAGVRQRNPEQLERERARAREMASVGTVQHIRPE
jgi:hypothetical protein